MSDAEKNVLGLIALECALRSSGNIPNTLLSLCFG